MLIIPMLLIGCPQPPVPPPNDADATPPPVSIGDSEACDGSVVSLAALRVCANLDMLGCVEGPKLHPDCKCVIDHVLAAKTRPFDADCVAGAANVDAVVKCNSGIVCKK
jgi:hypothetical protein